MDDRLFTVEEANALLPTLIPLVERVLAARQRITSAGDEVKRVLKMAKVNGGNQAASDIVTDQLALEKAALEIESHGVELKDINMGLLDFPAERDGKVVYLCWRYGEESVDWWHDTDAGYNGRQPL